MSILDVKRNKQDFLKHKSKSSQNTFVNYTFIFKSIEKFCITKYDSSLDFTDKDFDKWYNENFSDKKYELVNP